MNIVLWICAALLALVFFASGLMKATSPKEKLVKNMAWARPVPEDGIKALGLVEVLGALGLILPRATGVAPVLTPLAAVGCAIVMAGATLVHARLKETKAIPMTVVLLILAIVVAAGRF
jgi:uncharacterized membrane protein YphA (DoxX/SURF4 family)